jgi:hypothetical protein
MTGPSEAAPAWVGKVIAVLAIALFAYVAVRAFTVSFTYDESFSYVHHVRQDILFLDAFDEMGANHHMLNVWGMWASRKLFGDTEAALRLPSLLAFALYLFASARIALLTTGSMLAMGSFLLLVLHPYLLDFFMLARGYALAHAFLMVAAWQSLVHLRNGSLRNFGVACAGAALSVFSLVSMFSFLLAFATFWGLWLLRRNLRGEHMVRHWLILLTAVALPVAVMLPVALGLRSGGSLYYGCDTFWDCTMRTIAEQLAYGAEGSGSPLHGLTLYLVAAGVVLIAAIIRAGRKVQHARSGGFLFATTTLLLVLLSMFLQKQFLDVQLPLTRTGLYLLPLCALAVVTGLHAWHDRGRYAGPASLLLCMPLVVLFGRTANFHQVIEWNTTGAYRQALEAIAADRRPPTPERPSVNVRTCFQGASVMGYYVHAYQLYGTNYQMHSDSAFQPADYYIVEAGTQHMVDTVNWRPLYRSSSTDLTVYRDERFRKDLDQELHRASFTGANHEEHRFPTLTWIVPEHVGGPVLMSGWIDATEQGPTNWIGHIMELYRDGRMIGYESSATHIQLDRYGELRRTGVVLLHPGPLLAGDSICYRAWPYIPRPVISLGPAELRILH